VICTPLLLTVPKCTTNASTQNTENSPFDSKPLSRLCQVIRSLLFYFSTAWFCCFFTSFISTYLCYLHSWFLRVWVKDVPCILHFEPPGFYFLHHPNQFQFIHLFHSLSKPTSTHPLAGGTAATTTSRRREIDINGEKTFYTAVFLLRWNYSIHQRWNNTKVMDFINQIFGVLKNFDLGNFCNWFWIVSYLVTYDWISIERLIILGQVIFQFGLPCLLEPNKLQLCQHELLVHELINYQKRKIMEQTMIKGCGNSYG